MSILPLSSSSSISPTCFTVIKTPVYIATESWNSHRKQSLTDRMCRLSSTSWCDALQCWSSTSWITNGFLSVLICIFFCLYFTNKIVSASLSTDFSLSSSQGASSAASPPAAWIIIRRSPIVVTIPWKASAANCRPFSGVVIESPIHRSRFPNSPPAVTTAHSVASGTTWRPFWRKGPSTETRGRGGRREWRRRERGKGWVCRVLLCPRGAWALQSPCPSLPLPLCQLMSLTPSLAHWERGEVLMEVIWDKLRNGRGIVRHPRGSPKSHLTSHSHEDPRQCSPRVKSRAGARLCLIPSLQTTALYPTISTSAQETRGTWSSVSYPTRLWLWKDCPWETEVGRSGWGPTGMWRFL